jgi:sec-independent protein translocase protein TatC
MARLRPVSFEDRLTLVEHLDELRTRLIVCALVFAAALALCFWQNELLLDIANGPLPGEREPITFGVAEPFTTTLTISAYGAILLSLPVLLYQAYAFLLPALTPAERRTLVPFLVAVPFLFIGGVVFAYFVVLPAATTFLLDFNADEFNVEVRARDYYSFFALAEIAVGLLFQIPIGVLAVTRLGIVTPEQIASNRRYAVLVIAIVAMLLPGTDPITMLISMVPLLLLFEGSLLLARWFGRPPPERVAARTAPQEPS